MNFAFLGSAQIAKPQQGSQDDDVVRITTNLIQVDATVTDGDGNPVSDLNASDFEIQENGVTQKITHFSFVSTGVSTGAPTAAKPAAGAPPIPVTPLKPENVKRTIAVVIDDLGLSFESLHFVRDALKKFVDTQMQPGDLVAIVRTSSGAGALQQFTSDKRMLIAAIDRLRWNQLGRGGVSPFAPIQARSIADQVRADSKYTSDGGETLRDEQNQFRDEMLTVGTLGALAYVVEGLRDLPGRKSVLLVSDGIKVFTSTADNPRSLRLGISDSNYTSDRVLGNLRRLTDLANRSSVVIYTMDARGLQTLSMTAQDSVSGYGSSEIETQRLNRRVELLESQAGLNYLAEQTGGLAFRNNNDLAGGIKKMLADQLGYYLIGYEPNSETFDPKKARYNKLKISVKRKGLNVRYRSGFFGISDEEFRTPPPVTREQQLARAVVQPFVSGNIDVRLTSLFANDATTGSFMRSLLHVDAGKLTFTEEPDGWRKLVFDVMAITFGENGAVIDQLGRTENVRVRGETYDLIMKNGFDYIITVPIKKAGAYQLRTALRDSVSERIGTASQFIEVPDVGKNRLSLSGLILSGFDPSRQDPAALSPNATDAKLKIDPQAIPGVRRLKRGMILQVGFVIYNAQLDNAARKPQLQTQLRLFRDGQLIFAGTDTPFQLGTQLDMKRLNSGGRLQLASDMAPGEYVLQVIVTDLLAKEKSRVATQWIDFEIVE